tara:strand:- start:2225 stop:2341 length:117 start_codon:yes stop_codon:yes gene_type:complete
MKKSNKNIIPDEKIPHVLFFLGLYIFMYIILYLLGVNQ